MVIKVYLVIFTIFILDLYRYHKIRYIWLNTFALQSSRPYRH
ncbi:hypothetical protein PJIAN_4916 [Paludibacter jiangxiensis]|uniref:Uncharacterized protein n=1 Tax=Paludibacter jiangxiensis TaxID=681398 RepID=A0A161LG72_9BACT|nr:hypothetical protein PJIAN_4916 [Paludibacter jiangxiensis]